jgi:acetamidase/formamidase
MACWVNPGDDFILETFDWTGGFIKNNDSADDVRDIDLSTVHYLSGPVGVKGAEPGDLLVVDLLDIGAKQDSLWGFNGFFSKKNGGGFLTDHFPEAQKSIWDFKGMFTSSRHIPRVNFAGLIHPGLIGCLPDKPMLDMWNEREGKLIATDPTACRPGQPAVRRHRPHGQDDRRRARQGRGRRRAHRAAARARRQLRHQGPVARLQGVLPGLRRRRGPVAWATCTSARATARSPSAAPSRWPAGCT